MLELSASFDPQALVEAENTPNYFTRHHGYSFSSKRFIKNLVKDLLSECPQPVTIMDVGCGTGEAAYKLRKAFGNKIRLIGVDLDEENLKTGFQNRFYDKLFLGDAQDELLYDDDSDLASSVDLYMFCDLLEHIPIVAALKLLQKAQLNAPCLVSFPLYVTCTKHKDEKDNHAHHWTLEQALALRPIKISVSKSGIGMFLCPELLAVDKDAIDAVDWSPNTSRHFDYAKYENLINDYKIR